MTWKKPHMHAFHAHMHNPEVPVNSRILTHGGVIVRVPVTPIPIIPGPGLPGLPGGGGGSGGGYRKGGFWFTETLGIVTKWKNPFALGGSVFRKKKIRGIK